MALVPGGRNSLAALLALSWCCIGVLGLTADCQDDLRKYMFCSTTSGLFMLCSSKTLMNDTTVQAALGCHGEPEETRLKVCQENCRQKSGDLLNHSLDTPCSADLQSMHGFSAGLNLFTVGGVNLSTNISHSQMLPLPNIKGLGGLSLIDFGEPEKCAEIPSAQYCVLTGKVMNQASLSLGNCIPRSCSEEDIRDVITDTGVDKEFNMKMQCNLVRPVAGATGTEQLQDLLGWGGVPVEYPRTIEPTPGFWVMCVVCLFFLALVVVGSGLDVLREAKTKRLQELRECVELAQEPQDGNGVLAVPLRHQAEQPELPPRGPVETMLNHWSLLRNGRSFMRTRPLEQNTFACMDAIRTFSMAQVILGHMYVYGLSSAGIKNLEQFSPPYGALGTMLFQIIPGCFYGVDSFFVMSGFLCAYGLQQKVFSRPESTRPAKFTLMYIKFLVNRYLRLVPLEMFCIFFSTYVLPMIGTGILWNLDNGTGGHCFQAAGTDGCEKYWFTNLFFLQDTDDYTGKCYGHTWYLANDFQLYMTAPFFALAYGLDRRLGWALLSAGLIFGAVFPVIITLQNNWVPEIIVGGSKGFDTKFYFKPWCRCPAFFIGIAAGWLWTESFSQHTKNFSFSSRIRGYLLSCVGVGLCLAATFCRKAFFQCDLVDCSDPDKSPVPRPLQLLWAAFSIPTWCVGLCIIMVLCFQRRFIPIWQDFLCLSMWQPFAKLSYAAYLIHTTVLILDFCQYGEPIGYNANIFFYKYVSFVALSLLAAYILYVTVEKPLANLQMKLLGGGGE